MITDLHCHSTFSIDGSSSMRQMIEAGENIGLDIMAITDHADFADGDSCVEPVSYRKALQKAGSNRIKVLKGVEVGLQYEHRERFAEFMKDADFDFVIGSMHRACEKDFCNGEFYLNRSAEECWQIYFIEALKAVKACSDFDTFGHLDIITRYHSMQGHASPESMNEYLDPLLKWLIDHEKGLEVNTSKFHLFARCHPQPLILQRYRELGGEIITLGSDAHHRNDVGKNLQAGLEAIRTAGFSRLAWFEKRKMRLADL